LCYDYSMENLLFPKIKLSDGTISYGGNQAWYSSKAAADGGCGSVAAANALTALASSSSEVARKLGISPGRDGIYQESPFKSFMENVYSYVGSGFYFIRPFGIGIAKYVQRVLLYASRRGIYLRPHVYPTAFASYNRPVRFIYKGLKENGAVGLMASWNSYNAVFTYPKGSATAKIKNHFLTVTGIEKTEDGDYRLTVSTWGKKGTISYKEVYQSWQGFRAFGTALVFFTTGGSSFSVKKDIPAAPLKIWSAFLANMLTGIRKT